MRKPLKIKEFVFGAVEEGLEIRADAALCGSHVFCQLGLAWKAGVITPRVFEKHGVRELGADRNVLLREDEIRNLSESVARRKIGADNFYVTLFLLEDVADVAFRAVLHTLSLYGAHKPISPAYPLFWWDVARVKRCCEMVFGMRATCRDVSRRSLISGFPDSKRPERPTKKNWTGE